jgi:hypothetical protein
MAESDLWQALSDTIHRAVNLRVITMVGDTVVTGTLERLQVGAPVGNCPSLVTDINLVGGDITATVSEKLLGPEFADIRAAHHAAVTQAQEIVARNASLLVGIIKDIGNQIGALPSPSPGPVRTGATTGNT